VLNADIVLASDCVYLEIAFIPLIDTFFALTEKESAVIYLTYCKRRKADKKFFQLARKKFVFEEVVEDPKREEYRKKSIQLFRIKRK
jgi:predicted nicotinamide N-methyase